MPVAAPEETIRRLAAVELEEPALLSVYVDSKEFATAPAASTRAHALLDEGRRLIRASELRAKARRSVEQDLALIEAELADFDSSGHAGLALFLCDALGLRDRIGLDRAPHTSIALAAHPALRPMIEASSRDHWCVAVVSRERGRILVGSADALVEHGDLTDEVHGRHEQGGWSQRRYQESIENDVDAHLERVASVLTRLGSAGSYDRLALGGTGETTARLERMLSAATAELLAGRFEVDIDAPIEDVLAAARPLTAAAAGRRERELLERLDQSAGKNGRAAVGLEAVLEGLNQQRVETAILDPSFQAPLRQCPSCRLLTLAAASSCPADGSDLRLLEDGAEAIIRRALGQDGDVVLLSAQGAVTADDGLAATLRF